MCSTNIFLVSVSSKNNKSGNVARTLSLLEMCSNWSKTGRNASKRVKMGPTVPKGAIRRIKEGKYVRGRARKGKKS